MSVLRRSAELKIKNKEYEDSSEFSATPLVNTRVHDERECSRGRANEIPDVYSRYIPLNVNVVSRDIGGAICAWWL